MAVPQVYGLQETIAELQKFEPEMLKQARKDLKVAAESYSETIYNAAEVVLE